MGWPRVASGEGDRHSVNRLIVIQLDNSQLGDSYYDEQKF